MKKNRLNIIVAIILVLTMLSTIMTSCTTGQLESPTPVPNETAPDTQVPIETEDFSPDSSKEPEEIKIYSEMTDAEITFEINSLLESMTLIEKASQMIQAERSAISTTDLRKYPLGSVLSGGGSMPGDGTEEDWRTHISALQTSIMAKEPKIPLLYGIDAVHGNDHVKNAVIFPHNIGIGAANNADAMAEYGRIVAEEMKTTYVNWNFAPCIAVSLDPRWGRTYESFSSDTEIVSNLSVPFTVALQKNGIVATAKHYIGDGGTLFGTGEGDYLIDRGDVRMTEEEFRKLFLPPYVELISSGVHTVMASFSSVNGLKMHEHKYLLSDVLKDELGFKGFVISDWEGHHEIEAETYDEQVAIAINAGIDMLMEPYGWEKTIYSIVRGNENGSISMDRINDAVGRILRVKMESGIFDMKFEENYFDIGSFANRSFAESLVEESAVLLKNENNLLPLGDGTKIFVTGPAMDNVGVQCGGWTIDWQGKLDENGIEITEGTTLLEGLIESAEKHNFEIITDSKRINDADVVILAIGEKPYTEGFGDSFFLSAVSDHALDGNLSAIQIAENSGLPVITVIYAGRNIMIAEYIDDWDSVVMAYLPGTEGGGISNLLAGDAVFSGKLPMPWYMAAGEIGMEVPKLLFDLGYGLTY